MWWRVAGTGGRLTADEDLRGKQSPVMIRCMCSCREGKGGEGGAKKGGSEEGVGGRPGGGRGTGRCRNYTTSSKLLLMWVQQDVSAEPSRIPTPTPPNPLFTSPLSNQHLLLYCRAQQDSCSLSAVPQASPFLPSPPPLPFMFNPPSTPPPPPPRATNNPSLHCRAQQAPCSPSAGRRQQWGALPVPTSVGPL